MALNRDPNTSPFWHDRFRILPAIPVKCIFDVHLGGRDAVLYIALCALKTEKGTDGWRYVPWSALCRDIHQFEKDALERLARLEEHGYVDAARNNDGVPIGVKLPMDLPLVQAPGFGPDQ